jgi:hypothetical protein
MPLLVAPLSAVEGVLHLPPLDRGGAILSSRNPPPPHLHPTDVSALRSTRMAYF